MAGLAHTVAEFAVAAAIGAASAAGGAAVSVVGLVFQISEAKQKDALQKIQADHKDRSIALIGGYWARKGLSTPDQNKAEIAAFVEQHGGTAWVSYWPHEGALLLWHHKKDFRPVKGSSLFVGNIVRGTQNGNEWATNP